MKTKIAFDTPVDITLEMYLQNLGIPYTPNRDDTTGIVTYNNTDIHIDINITRQAALKGTSIPLPYSVPNTPTSLAFLFAIGALRMEEAE